MNRIVAISMVKNEADIIECFVRHALTFADAMIVADQESFDDTGQILANLAAEGLPLTVRQIHRTGHIQEEVMNTLLAEAITDFGADIVVPLDADEFLVNTDTPESCRKILQGLSRDALYSVRWRRYEPLGGEGAFSLTGGCRRAKGDEAVGKVVVGAVVTEVRPFHLAQGQHFAHWQVGQGWAPIPLAAAPPFHIAHFHWRSPAQFAAKVAVGWLNNVVKYSPYTVVGEEWKRAFDRLLRDEDIDAVGRLSADAAEPFDLRPHVADIPLRYTASAQPSVLARVLAAGERIAASLAEEKVRRRNRRVTVVIPFGGDEAGLAASIRNVLAQEYDNQEIWIPVMGGADPRRAKAVGAAFKDAGTPIAAIAEPPGASIGEALEQVASGDYVQYLFPGDCVAEDKFLRMMACLESQPPLDWVFERGADAQAAGGFADDILRGTNFAMVNGRAFWRQMLLLGAYPAGGVAAGFFRRGFVAARDWLMGDFLGEQPLFWHMWRTALLPIGGQQPPTVGVLSAGGGSSVGERPPLETLWREMEWCCLLQEAWDTLNEEEIRQVGEGLCAAWSRMAKARRSAPTPLWETYETAVQELAEKAGVTCI
ncbi:MAG: glycosyltransferase family 2 protein [Schwartzia sp. (in: firmicutes)]